MRRTVLILALLLMTLPLFAATRSSSTRPGSHSLQKQRKLRTHLRTRGKHWRLRRIFIPWSPVKGSRESLLRQNEKTDGLERIQDDEQLTELVGNGALVDLPSDRSVDVASNLPENRRYCRAWTRSFVEDFAHDYYEEFHEPLTVTSAVRTVEVQKKLRRHNHNAADIDGDLASPHLTGATIDIGKRGMTKKQLEWCRNYLLDKQNGGNIDVEEEFRQRVFHITVYKDYVLDGAQNASAPEAVAPAAQPAGGAPAAAPAASQPVAAPDDPDESQPPQ
jgi:hypothetical protein